MQRALAQMGQDESRAQFHPLGGLRWRAESDKQGFHTLTPLSEPARAALDAYLEQNPRVGDVPLFPALPRASALVSSSLTPGTGSPNVVRGRSWNGIISAIPGVTGFGTPITIRARRRSVARRTAWRVGNA